MAQTIVKSDGFSVGDVVALKTGGPDLVVVGFQLPATPAITTADAPRALLGEATPDVRVIWFNPAGNFSSFAFPASALNLKTKAEPDAVKSV